MKYFLEQSVVCENLTFREEVKKLNWVIKYSLNITITFLVKN
jgi:hypothetical protein